MQSGVWVASGRGAQSLLRLASNLMMTRLLAPEAFGLMAIASAASIWLNMMSDLGLNGSIMRSKSPRDPAFYSTVWWTQVGRNVLIAAILVIAALLLEPLRDAGILKPDTVYADPMLPAFLVGVAAAAIIRSFGVIRFALYQREVDIAPITRIEVTSQIASMVAMLSFAFAGFGPYSLIAGIIVSAAWQATASFVILDGPKVHFRFERSHFLEIFNYGKWILVSSTFGVIGSQGDKVIFGWLFDKTSFSLYAIATIWILAAGGILQLGIRQVAYPVFVEIHRERPEDMSRIYGKLQLGVEAASIALFLSVIAFSDIAIGILYKDEYAGVAHYAKLLAVTFLLLPRRLIQTVILAAGDSRRFMLATVLPSIALLVGTPFVHRWFGNDAAIVYAAMTPIIAMPYNWIAARPFMSINYPREFAQFALAGLAGPLLLIYV